jgi:hypothetical protein
MIRIKTVDSVMCEIYQRIVNKKPFDKNLKPYSKEKIEKVIEYFENKEDYEKCHELSSYINLNHEIEYTKKGKF